MKIPILLYHSISDDNSEMSLSVDVFENQIKYLKNNGYTSINFDEISREISILYKDEINYAFSNIIQNAIQHSKNKVYITISRNLKELSIKITDDGNGFSKDIIDKLGEPYISKNSQGMGLGIFIAKNLIENMGGNLSFYNSNDNNAVVEIAFDNSILNI